MERIYEKDLSAAAYRSRDPIKNLKIKVSLKRLSASTVGFRPEVQEEDQHTIAVNQFGQTVLEEEELTLHWQQKFFSQREIEFYGFEPNCTSVADYKYHTDVENIKKRGGRSNNRIFTYVNNDRFSVGKVDFSSATTSKDEKESKLAAQISNLRRRRNADQQPAIKSWDMQGGAKQTGLKMIENEPNDEFKANHHLLNTPMQTFTIMVDLSPAGQLGSAEFERPLCTLEYDENFVLRVSPDFTSGPCRLQESNLSRDVYEYTLTNASAQVSKLEARREAKMIAELYNKHQTYLKGLVGEDFEELPPNLFRLVVTGEILSAESFEYNHLHIEYFLDLPKLWTCDSTLLLSGCTQSCKTTLQNNIETAYFSYPFEYQVFLDLNEDEGTLEWPKMFIHVISVDTWDRRRTEGYGYLSLPTTPGQHEVRVNCWRPTGNAGYPSVLAEMRRYFVGGNPELEDVMYTAVPSTFEGKRMSKYGVRGASSGVVRIRLHCVQQCQAFRSEASTAISKKKWQTALQIAKGRASEAAIHGILEAYNRARKRMLLAREKVPSQTRVDAQKIAREKTRNMTIDDQIKLMQFKAASKKED